MRVCRLLVGRNVRDAAKPAAESATESAATESAPTESTSATATHVDREYLHGER
jgi:hypothetical protein